MKDETTSISNDDEFLKGLEEAIQEVNDIKAGKKKGTTLREFLDEL